MASNLSGKIDRVWKYILSRMSTPETLQFQPPHPNNDKEKQFLGQLKSREKELHSLAVQMLGSSYFTGKTHGFTAWLKSTASKSNPSTQPQATK